MLLIAAIGCAGIAIGVASLILVVSFMNGAEARLAGQIAAADGHIFATPNRLGRVNWRALEVAAREVHGVAGAVSSLNATGVITAHGRSLGADLQGVSDSARQSRARRTSDPTVILGRWPTGSGTMALGNGLAAQLGLGVGDHAAITLPRFVGGNLSVDNFEFIVVGILNTDVPSFDDRRTVIPVEDLRTILKSGETYSTMSITLEDPSRLRAVLKDLRSRLGSRVSLRTWQQMNAALFGSLAQERVAMTVIISLVTLVALSNILSSMMMLVRSKVREIAILRSCGISRSSVAKIFIAVGTVIGMAGELSGLIFGFSLKASKDAVAERLLSIIPRYRVELEAFASIPLSISNSQVAWIVILVGAGVLLSTLYPALRAADVDPASVLRYT